MGNDEHGPAYPEPIPTRDCPDCERRRREMVLMLEAAKQWTKNPIGPNVHEVYLRLRAKAEKEKT